ncbi:MAG: hypothetical protein HC902_10490 [Calothrix sp. SM1_5_4]|nr:hypothetical protein [Calothrix sp. SM1_5_4]
MAATLNAVKLIALFLLAAGIFFARVDSTAESNPGGMKAKACEHLLRLDRWNFTDQLLGRYDTRSPLRLTPVGRILYPSEYYPKHEQRCYRDVRIHVRDLAEWDALRRELGAPPEPPRPPPVQRFAAGLHSRMAPSADFQLRPDRWPKLLERLPALVRTDRRRSIRRG